MRGRLCLPVMIAFSLLTACVASAPRQPTTRPTVISAAELRKTDATNVYDAIQRLRPAFFTTRGGTSFLAEPAEPILVILNQMVVTGGLAELQHIESASVRSIRRLSAAEVFNMTGRSAPAGGIEVLFGP